MVRASIGVVVIGYFCWKKITGFGDRLDVKKGEIKDYWF